MSALSFRKLTHLSFHLPANLKSPFRLSFLASCILALAFLILYFRLPPVVPLFYSLAEPNDYLAPKEWLGVIPALSFLITFFHLILIRMLYHHEKIIPTMFAWATVIIQFLFLLAFVRIISIVM
jgi:hypothetical protein